jgi:SAM-dependent methyltransferase
MARWRAGHRFAALCNCVTDDFHDAPLRADHRSVYHTPMISVWKPIAVSLLLFAQPPTPDIHYVPTSSGVADAMLKLAGVTAADTVYDLGSGDGRIVIAAAKKYGARGVGIELDSDLVKKARKNARSAGVADRVTFLQQDLFKADLSDATVVTLYLSNSVNMRVRGMLQRQLRPGARVVSHRFLMGDWQPEAEQHVEGTSIYLWTISPR